jgi:hypothetical protein
MLFQRRVRRAAAYRRLVHRRRRVHTGGSRDVYVTAERRLQRPVVRTFVGPLRMNEPRPDAEIRCSGREVTGDGVLTDVPLRCRWIQIISPTSYSIPGLCSPTTSLSVAHMPRRIIYYTPISLREVLTGR